MTDQSPATPDVPPPPSLLAGVGVTAVVLVGIIIWIALASPFLGETSLLGGFLMLWYWAKVEQLSIARLPASIIGALVGIGVAWALYYGATHYGAAGLAAGLALLILAVYLDIVAVFPSFVNGATMLYVTVAAAPLVQLKVNWIELSFATVSGGLFFAAFVAAAMALAARFAPKPG